MTNVVYSITVLDFRTDAVLGFRRTPGIFTRFSDAEFVVLNNLQDIADAATYQYAVIETTQLNRIRPTLEMQSRQRWFKYNSVQDRFFPCTCPAHMRLQTGFGIG